ncbi:MAG: tRNA (N6-threonylcarbamoyladenosine(37)-N6)-methyltransferase TrmO [Thermoplasmatota archaeon]
MKEGPVESDIVLRPIGVIRTPFKEFGEVPRQPMKGIQGTLEVFDEYKAGLKGLEGRSHMVLLFHLHLQKKHLLEVVPYGGLRITGVFSTRAPMRPNHIGLSVVRLKKIEGNILTIEDIDMIDGSPLIDIKPHMVIDPDEQGG